jgi:hypothetical protein
MNTNKIMYWLALGVFALGLHSEYRNGRFPALHRLADHAASTLCRIATRAEQTVALARVLASPQPASANDLFASVWDQELAQSNVLRDQAQAHAELLRDQVRARADLMRAQVGVQQSQIERIRWGMQSQFKLRNAAQRRVTLICPKTGARISVNAGPSDVEVSDTF